MLVVPLVVVLAAGVAAEAVHRYGVDRSRARDRAVAQRDIARFEDGLATAAGMTAQVADAAADGDTAFVTAASDRIAADGRWSFALVRGGRAERVISRAADDTSVGTAVQTAAVQDAVASAIDDAATHVTSVRLREAMSVAIVEPGLASGTRPSIIELRASPPPVVVAMVSISALRNPLEQPALWPDADVAITTVSATIGSPVRNPVVTGRVRAADVAWSVAVGPTPLPRPVLSWLVLLAGLVAAGAVYVVAERHRRERREAALEVETRTRQLEIIARTSSSLQQSLNLGDVLPAFAVDVVDEFQLSAISVSVSDDDGRLVEVFRYGRASGNDERITIDLRRGWRSVGALVASSPVAIDMVTQQSLRAIGDLLAIAVTNAQLFEREQQAVTRLSELDALKNAFLGTVSHELRTATTAVQGFGELLTDHWESMPDERRRDLASRIRRQAGSLRHLVDDLLDYARLERESLRVNPRELDLGQVVEHLTQSMSPIVSNHEVVVNLEPGVVAWADPIAVERILANLLSNAGKYAPSGTTVTVTVARHGERARLSVADQGPGIPEEERRRVFVRFYRMNDATTISTHGAGIGLSILRDFAERSAAEVTIDDAPGGGALITIDFPTAPVGAVMTE